MRVFSGIQPTGHPTLGNLLGAVRQWVTLQRDGDALFCVVDLHALTIEHDPAELGAATRRAAALLLAAGLDPQACTIFAQSHVGAHTRLSALMEATAYEGEMRRMTQYKEKSAEQESVRLSLLTYPALMAADILAYGAEIVPVGEDQRQHLELARDLALRFNRRYGETFVVPEARTPKVAARVMDLQNPAAKMRKSSRHASGCVYLLDPPEVIERKVMRAVTDAEREVRYDREAKPGVANLLAILAACRGGDPEALAGSYSGYGYGALKRDVAAAVVELLRPLQDRYRTLTGPDGAGYVDEVLAAGAARAEEAAAERVERAYAAVGLLPRPGGPHPPARTLATAST